MKELSLGTWSAVDEAGREHHYRYSILVGEMDVGPFFCESYGIAVTDGEGHSAQVPNITTSIAKIDQLSELVTRGRVSPAHLRDVVEDWL